MEEHAKTPLVDTLLRVIILFLLIVWCIGTVS